MNMEKIEKIERVVFYIRVSKEEQKLHGLSLQSQMMKLQEYADKHNLKVVGVYADEGVSGRKLIRNRPQLQKMLNDAQKKMFDRIIFIKLDRYFRSVAEYHECQKKLDEVNVTWSCTEEKYDLTTANGRAFVNMKLTIAELEADQTGERIKIVNDYKVKSKQAISGSVPFPWTLVKKEDGRSYYEYNDENKKAVEDMIDYFLTHQNTRKTMRYLADEHGLIVSYRALVRVLKNPMLYGYYRDVENYCPAYIDKSTFDKIQNIFSKNIKLYSNRVYIFSGLLVCPRCGRKLVGNFVKRKSGKEYLSYRCGKKNLDCSCEGFIIGEPRLEKYLLTNLESEINKVIRETEIKVEDAMEYNQDNEKEIKKLKKELERLNLMFQKGRIKEAVYDVEYEAIDKQIKTLESSGSSEKRDLSKLKDLLNTDFKSMYEGLTPDYKRAFWRSIIDRIEFNDGKINIIFL